MALPGARTLQQRAELERLHARQEVDVAVELLPVHHHVGEIIRQRALKILLCLGAMYQLRDRRRVLGDQLLRELVRSLEPEDRAVELLAVATHGDGVEERVDVGDERALVLVDALDEVVTVPPDARLDALLME